MSDVLHMIPARVWEQARHRGWHETSGLLEHGAISCTRGRAALLGHANAHHRRSPEDWVVLSIAVERVRVPYRREEEDGAPRLRILGRLELEAVSGHCLLPRAPDGTFLDWGDA
jgi:uncharacterized protein (DUF952 family)